MLLLYFVGSHFSVRLVSMNCKTRESADLNSNFGQQRQSNETSPAKKHSPFIRL